jgi:hypothetical protein
MSGLFVVRQGYKSMSPSQIADEGKIRSPQHCGFARLSHDEPGGIGKSDVDERAQ